MTTKELNIVLNCLERIKKPNPFADEAIAYVKKDLAIRDSIWYEIQTKLQMRDMNKGESEYLW